MYLLLGQKSCSRCDMVKKLFENKGIKFDYSDLEDLAKEEKNKYTKMAEDADMIELPIIIKDNVVIDFREVIQ